MTVTTPETSSEAKLLAICESHLFIPQVDDPTKIQGVQHSVEELAITMDMLDISNFS